MSKINWYYILKLPEFNSYFTSDQLITLSLTCKKFRSCLKSKVFSNFNFNTFISTGNYKSLEFTEKDDGGIVDIHYIYNPFVTLTEDYIKSRLQFKHALELFPCQPEKLVLFDCINYTYLLYDFPEVFSKVSSLSLELSFNKFISSPSSINSKLEISWPTSLRSVNIEGNNIGYVNNTYNHIRLFHFGEPDLSMGRFKLYPNHLPNLKSFCFEASLDDVIVDYSTCFPRTIDYTTAPVLKSVKSLELTISEGLYRMDGLSLQYPNLTRLIVNVKSRDYNQISQLISNIPTLKSLKLILNYNFVFSRDLELPKLNYLERVEFFTIDNFDHIENKFKVYNCPKLRLIEYTKTQKYEAWKVPKYIPILNNGWELRLFPYKYAFYKIND
ncbi:hypothetical protein CONCODRAFT_13065 [Conidiobolus coronatus NRRL 28638]|uniref:F-box domain-containing protein n=1 Tax=Conidiobolus coronatus (strain ATCC 28846 / CBS 209.66 / NRRL 28638) TaxID=796925 RepID=A0A137NRK0_CONC2|nr:hypothetical protein CONCODRAFT_13065 [Conidiobolus coronatus NRRL 28638]|eukprot:KXN65365.1 hypothetical protein CONCODRAFT_13065 [Conidiobolus coronatus NRRL 28638]